MKILFIINPISGTYKGKNNFPELARTILDTDRWEAEYVYTERPGHGRKLAQQAATDHYDAVVSVGGDGTLNEVADGLRDSQTALGIIPLGSGNGFARHMGIEMNITEALRRLNTAEPHDCDYGLANDRFFISTCGTGFDATVADDFARSGHRGFWTYLRYSVRDAFTFRPEHICLHQEGFDWEGKAYMVNFANAGQWGYGASIAPQAKVDDGLLDVTIMSQHAPLVVPGLVARMYLGNMKGSPCVDSYTTSEVTIRRDGPYPFHIDGTPEDMPAEVHVRIVAKGLKILL